MSFSYGSYEKDGYTIKSRSFLFQKEDVTTFKFYDSTGTLRRKSKMWMSPENPLTISKDITTEWTDSLKLKRLKVLQGSMIQYMLKRFSRFFD